MASPEDVANLIDEAMEEATADVTAAELLTVGHLALNIIVMRTKSGRDADLKQFAPYSPDYKKQRERKGLQTASVDLAVTGHMLGGMIVKADANAAEISFLSATEAVKANAHDQGNNSAVLVKSHSRSAYVNAKSGQRVSQSEYTKDQRRKNPRTKQRVEKVGEHKREMGLPQRNFFDVRADPEVDVITEALGEAAMRRVEKVLK